MDAMFGALEAEYLEIVNPLTKKESELKIRMEEVHKAHDIEITEIKIELQKIKCLLSTAKRDYVAKKAEVYDKFIVE